MDVHIRWMIRRDMPEVLEIESQCFGSFAWDEDDFLNALRHRNCIGMVAEHKDAVIGFMVYELHKTQLHLLNFAVLPKHHGQGVGDAMVIKLVGKLSPKRRERITCEIRESNLSAQLFFRAQGFVAVSIMRGFYTDPPCDDDAYIFEFRLAKPKAVPTNRIAGLFA